MFGCNEFPTLVEPAPVLIIQTEDSDQRTERDIETICQARGVSSIANLITIVARNRPPTPRFNLLSDAHYEGLLASVKASERTYAKSPRQSE